MAIRGAGRGSGAMVGVVGWFLTHFVRPFSIAHLLGRAGGIWISFSSLARLASCLFSLIRICVARIVSVPGSVVCPCVALGDMLQRVGGVIWLLVPRPVPSSRSAARSISPYRLAGGMRAPFLSAHSPASFVGGRADRFPFRLVFRLACSSCGASRDYSLRFACQSVSSRRFAGVSLFRLARRSVSCSSVLLVVPRCLVLPGLSSPLVSPGFSLSSPCSLVSLGRLVSAARRAGRIICHPSLVSFSFCSRIISLVAVSWPWRRRLVLSPVSWRRWWRLPCGCCR